jgi:hypothetical protein
MSCKYKYNNTWYSKEELKSILFKERGISPDGKLEKPEIKVQSIKYVVKDNINDLVFDTFDTKEEAEKIKNEKNKNFFEDIFYVDVKNIGKQPTQTKENTTSIESVKSKLGISKNTNDRKKWLKDEISNLEKAQVLKSNKNKNPYKDYDRVVIENEYFAYEKNGEFFVQDMSDQYGEPKLIDKELFESKIKEFGDSKKIEIKDDYYLNVPDTIYFSDRFETKKEAEDYIKNSIEEYSKELESLGNEKEYTSQALINLKIAALKEVARKYPRSLITSKVVPIDKNLVQSGERQYSKVEKNLSTEQNNAKFNKNNANNINNSLSSINQKYETEVVRQIDNKIGINVLNVSLDKLENYEDFETKFC